jgi:RND family efflux transporter MFP subunit
VALLLSFLVLAGAGGLLLIIFNTEPEAERIGARRKSAMLVDTLVVNRGDYQPQIRVLGEVQAAREVVLRPRVEGEVLEISEEFYPGGIVSKGDRLVRINPADYENALARAESAVRRAEANLRIELGRQDVARQDFELLRGTLSEENEALVLREPQLNSARAEVEAARADLEQARLNLDRTRITAPFDAQVLTREVNLGSQVSARDPLARLLGVDTYWVIATVPRWQIGRIQFAAGDRLGSRVRLTNRSAWPDGASREGRVKRLIGALDNETRLARILITVDDPLARRADNEQRPSLLVGSILEVSIAGVELEDVVRLKRDYVRRGDTIWVNDDSELRIREADIVFRDAVHAYVRDGLEDGDEVVTTNLSTIAEGAGLRVENRVTSPVSDALAGTDEN